MNEAKKLENQQPTLMAVEKENRGNDTVWSNRKKSNIDIAVLLTWIVVIVLVIIFWFLISALFKY